MRPFGSHRMILERMREETLLGARKETARVRTLAMPRVTCERAPSNKFVPVEARMALIQAFLLKGSFHMRIGFGGIVRAIRNDEHGNGMTIGCEHIRRVES